ncbi:hypothetical protein Taro_039037 [Colocasia esculenta]|uniref:Uncharacterized protein n=1 Tax=Colocasia esculenta TaxID=4460 RepID=A0A843WEJ8_COLES|nr:hypothetical protein [Colocasia esculenta]
MYTKERSTLKYTIGHVIAWQLGEQEIPTPSRSSSPLCLLRPAQIVILKSTKAFKPLNKLHTLNRTVTCKT